MTDDQCLKFVCNYFFLLLGLLVKAFLTYETELVLFLAMLENSLSSMG